MVTNRDGATMAAHSSGPEHCAAMVADSSNEGAMDGVGAATLDRFGKLNIMVANAGIEGVAQLVAFLSSNAASYCSGGLYLADGGYVAS